jgi:hypothetical protein
MPEEALSSAAPQSFCSPSSFASVACASYSAAWYLFASADPSPYSAVARMSAACSVVIFCFCRSTCWFRTACLAESASTDLASEPYSEVTRFSCERRTFKELSSVESFSSSTWLASPVCFVSLADSSRAPWLDSRAVFMLFSSALALLSWVA